MEVNGQKQTISLQFNANKSKIPVKTADETGLVMKDIKPSVLPKRARCDKRDCDNEFSEKDCLTIEEEPNQRSPSPAESLKKLTKIGVHTDVPSRNHSRPGSPSFRRENSVRSLKNYHHVHMMNDLNKPSSSDSGSHVSKPFSDAASVRSWASVGMGSTDGKKMIVRRVPTSPVELFNIVNPPTPPEEYLYENGSDDGSGDDEDSVYIKPRRQNWSNKFQFVLACVGYSVGLGSIWRFPYLCYKSGGAVFLIPYAILMLICGVPMLYMELSVGQFTGRGPIGALGHLCPLFKGTGLGSVVISFLMSTYYSVIIAYGVYYFFTSFRAKQPWEDCSHRWNTKNCWSTRQQKYEKSNDSQSPAAEFYDHKVLQIGKGIEDFDVLRWELVACLICAWILIYFAIWKSIKSSAKVRYFTATFPFIIIIVLLIKSLTLEGAGSGMKYFWKPKFELLLDAKVWVNAACQTFNSMGCAFGSMICFASYNKYNNNILHDTIAVSFVNAVTSILVGIFAFATLGNIAFEQNTAIENVVDDGPGLIFVVYPQAMAKMPASQLWAVFFFFMLICLSLNSQFAIVEVVVTSIQDGFPGWIRKHLMCHEVLVLIICVISFLCGIPNVTKGGIYFFQLIDHYAATISVMYLAFFEVIAISWFYGAYRLSKNVKTMTGRHPGMYIKFCWMFATPLTIFALWVFLIIDFEPPTYNNGQYHYPTWAIVLGWIISALSILCIPIYMIVVFVRSPGDNFIEKLKNSIKSDLLEKCPKCDEMDCDCVIKDEECGPMLVMHTPDIRRDISVPYNMYNQPSTIPRIQSAPRIAPSPADTLSQYDNVNKPNDSERK
ncbi:sodium- and chloride-dependent GABA transporter ine-like isoform X2 [Aethina tumida]|uniref:sodium- and chloride-dependent GABA transporter ine-like isoform X2 n=1 Tax=Aethina tumida TaxID=116153 RepID=UPI00214894CA|nr:sodium- and chloride-dependent GABA transporter ine-like isoform X2 [Aethina tumida]